MPELPDFQHRFRLAKHDDTGQRVASRIHKRHRQPKSCDACQDRKLKCDRQTPCSQCLKRGDSVASKCTFTGQKPNGQNESVAKTPDLQQRLRKLEQTISLLAGATSGIAEERSSVVVQNQSSKLTVKENIAIDGMIRSKFQSTDLSSDYLGPTNWAAVLSDIRDVQEALHPIQDAQGQSPNSALFGQSDLLFDRPLPLTIADVLQSLPPRHIADILVSGIFESGNSQSPIIHSGKFLREYESFWQDPFKSSFLWISIFFSVLWTGSFCLHGPDRRGFDIEKAKPVFLRRAKEALVIGNYHRPNPYALEALLMYTHCRYHAHEASNDIDVNIILGVASRLALKMGYHRDPSHFGNISAFEGEMRRRAFFILQTFDLLVSFNGGLPLNIHEADCDTEPPRNLLDEDFDEDCESLPASRPETDRTPMLYFSYKARFAKYLKTVIRHAISPTRPPYSETVRLDAQLQSAYGEVPIGLQMKPFSSLLTDTARMIINRLHIELLYLKSICVLHRTYLTQERGNPSYAHSRSQCLNAAMLILHRQTELYEASRSGGRFEDNPWIVSTMKQHDFLLAGMIIALDLYESFVTGNGNISTDDSKAYRQKYMTLQQSHNILSQQVKNVSRAVFEDGRRACNVLAIVLSKLPEPARLFSDSSTASTAMHPTTTDHVNLPRLDPTDENFRSANARPPPGNERSVLQQETAPPPINLENATMMTTSEDNSSFSLHQDFPQPNLPETNISATAATNNGNGPSIGSENADLSTSCTVPTPVSPFDYSSIELLNDGSRPGDTNELEDWDAIDWVNILLAINTLQALPIYEPSNKDKSKINRV